MEKDIEKEEGGPLGRIFRSLLQGVRPASSGSVDTALVKKEAQKLYDVCIIKFESLILFIYWIFKAGQGKVGTDELEFVRILCSRSYSELRIIFEEYYKISNTDIEKAIKKEMSGDLERACLAIGKSFYQFFFVFLLN